MATPKFDFAKVRADFPVLSRKIRGKDLLYLDSTASAQSPLPVVNAVADLYKNDYANIHRGVHYLSAQLTARYEAVREQIRDFLGAPKVEEIILTKGTTESVNLVAAAWGLKFLKKGDGVLVTSMEHHSNFVPWQAFAGAVGADFRILEATQEGFIELDVLDAALAKKPKILAITAMSNVLGSVPNIKEIAIRCKSAGTLVFVDAAQGVPHLDHKLSDYGPIDFLAFSSHKMCGPSGVGVLWAHEELLEAMDPYQFGGDMIAEVGDQKTTWNRLPWKFEAGTPHISGVIGLGAAIDYLNGIGRSAIHAWESELARYALERLGKIPGIRIFGPQSAENRGAVFSFLLDGIHPHDVGSFLDADGIAVRVGHHCAQPLMRRLGVEGTCRASFYFYNTLADADRLAEALLRAQKVFR